MNGYSYNTPEQAIISLEQAYTNRDLEAIIASKDFTGEAKFILAQSSYKYDLTDIELISETANLLRLTLIKHLQDEGYPDFENVERQFSEIKGMGDNLYSIEEILMYPNGETYSNIVYLSKVDALWKIVTTE